MLNMLCTRSMRSVAKWESQSMSHALTNAKHLKVTVTQTQMPQTPETCAQRVAKLTRGQYARAPSTAHTCPCTVYFRWETGKDGPKKKSTGGLTSHIGGTVVTYSKLVLAIPFLLCVRRVHKQDIIAGVVSFKTSRGPNFMRQMPCMMPAV